MAFTINGIDAQSMGLYISTTDGLNLLSESKEQFYTAYGYEGYQLTKRKGNDYEINGFIIADDMADFLWKTAALYALMSNTGLRNITDNKGNSFSAFCKDGYEIDKVYVYDQVFARIKIKMTIISEAITPPPPIGGVFSPPFNDKFS